jgi:hypothetical protein
MNRFDHFKAMLFAVMAIFYCSACSSGVLINGKSNGGGSLYMEDGTRATFSASGSSCDSEDGTTTGRFTYVDKNVTNPPGGIIADGTLTNLHQCDSDGGCFDSTVGTCPKGGYLFTFVYQSNNSKAPGTGTGSGCFADNGEGNKADSDTGIIGFVGGPYDGYIAQGFVAGNVQSHLCD